MKRIRKIKRRKLLEGLTAAGIVAAVAPMLSCGSDSEAPPAADEPTVTVYRFQTLKSDRCNACKNHQHYKVFLDPATADVTRAHPGCNCRIVEQQMPLAYYESIEPYLLGNAVDLRAVYVV